MANFQRWMGELIAWQMGQNAQIQNAAAAAGYGLDPSKIGLTPFPGTAQPVITNITVTPPAALPAPTATPPAVSPASPPATAPAASSIPSWFLPALAALGIATGVGGVGVGTGVIPIGTTPPAIVQPVAPVAPVIPTIPALNETVTWVSTDGGQTWKQVPVTKGP
jgi:hypothetical protein